MHHPNISFWMSSSVMHPDFTAGQTNVDLRYGAPHWPQLTVRPVFDEQIMPLASPAFIRRHSIPAPEDLTQVPNLKVSKGMTYERVRIDPTGPVARFVASGAFLEASSASTSQLRGRSRELQSF
jgi:DNA-binding transcriptional LysR family regulator